MNFLENSPKPAVRHHINQIFLKIARDLTFRETFHKKVEKIHSFPPSGSYAMYEMLRQIFQLLHNVGMISNTRSVLIIFIKEMFYFTKFCQIYSFHSSFLYYYSDKFLFSVFLALQIFYCERRVRNISLKMCNFCLIKDLNFSNLIL